MTRRGMRICILTTTVIISLTTSALAVAAGVVKVNINGQPVQADKYVQTFQGRTMVSLRWVAEALGADVTWDAAARTINIQDNSKQKLTAKANRFEKALTKLVSPKNPEEAVEIWVQGLKERDAALQYAVLSPELRQKNLSEFNESYWTTGGSSPWVEDYEILDQEQQPDDSSVVKIKLKMKTSAEESINVVRVVVDQIKEGQNPEKWLITNILYTAETEIPEADIHLTLPKGWSIWRDTIKAEHPMTILDSNGQAIGRAEKVNGYLPPVYAKLLSQEIVDCEWAECKLEVQQRSGKGVTGQDETWKEVHLLVPLVKPYWLDISLKASTDAEISKLKAELQQIAKSLARI